MCAQTHTPACDIQRQWVSPGCYGNSAVKSHVRRLSSFSCSSSHSLLFPFISLLSSLIFASFTFRISSPDPPLAPLFNSPFTPLCFCILCFLLWLFIFRFSSPTLFLYTLLPTPSIFLPITALFFHISPFLLPLLCCLLYILLSSFLSHFHVPLLTSHPIISALHSSSSLGISAVIQFSHMFSHSKYCHLALAQTSYWASLQIIHVPASRYVLTPSSCQHMLK